MAKLEQEVAYLNVAVPPAVHSAVHVAAAESLTNMASYVRMAVLKQLRADGLLNPGEQVLRG
jgi:hypothetical protein